MLCPRKVILSSTRNRRKSSKTSEKMGTAVRPVRLPVSNDINSMVRASTHKRSIGVFELMGVPKMPKDAMIALFKAVTDNPDLARRANEAYTANLVVKDSYAAGKGGALVDFKKVWASFIYNWI